jgi:SAM-dependent methyltransferase
VSTIRRLEARLRREVRWRRLSLHRKVLIAPKRVCCSVCGWSGSRMAADFRGRKGRLCPRCCSSERDRALALELRSRSPAPRGARLLEIAPIGLVEALATELGYEHHSADLSSTRATVRADLCGLPFPDRSFDLVVCFHVLEHIPDDRSAARELRRVLRSGGEALVVVPFDAGRAETFEDPTTPPEDRERLYGQSDHVRIYGADVSARWREGGVVLEESLWSERFAPEEVVTRRIAGRDDRFWIFHPAD